VGFLIALTAWPLLQVERERIMICAENAIFVGIVLRMVRHGLFDYKIILYGWISAFWMSPMECEVGGF
jgi:hypothetical protein